MFCRWHNIATALLLLSLPWPAQGAGAERFPRDGPDEIRAEVTIPTPVARVQRALEAPCQLRQWTPQLDRLEVLETPDPDKTLVYIATDVSWPFSPRDGITLFSRHEGPPLVIKMHSRAEALPPVKGYVRIPFSEGRWVLHDEGSNRTRVEYIQRVVAGGKVSQWMSDRAGLDHAEELLNALEQHATRGDEIADCQGNS